MRVIEIIVSIFLLLVGVYTQAGMTYGLTWGLLSLMVGGFGAGWYLCKSFYWLDKQTIKHYLERIVSPDYPVHDFWKGSEQQFRLKMWPSDSEPYTRETIIMVAIKHPNGCIYASPPLARHADLFAVMENYGDGLDPKDPSYSPFTDQGFITNRGRYVGRYEAMSIAKRSDQLIRISATGGNDDELYSEDLFNSSLYNKYVAKAA